MGDAKGHLAPQIIYNSTGYNKTMPSPVFSLFGSIKINLL